MVTLTKRDNFVKTGPRSCGKGKRKLPKDKKTMSKVTLWIFANFGAEDCAFESFEANLAARRTTRRILQPRAVPNGTAPD